MPQAREQILRELAARGGQTPGEAPDAVFSQLVGAGLPSSPARALPISVPGLPLGLLRAS